MSISFAQYDAGTTQIKHHEGLVIGFMVQTWEHEVMYALFADGTMKRTNKIARPNDSFNRSTRKWHVVDAIPANAEFIGNYPADM